MQGHPTFNSKWPQPLMCASLWDKLVKIMVIGILNCPNYCVIFMVRNLQKCLQAGQHKQVGHRLKTPTLPVIYLFIAYLSTQSELRLYSTARNAEWMTPKSNQFCPHLKNLYVTGMNPLCPAPLCTCFLQVIIHSLPLVTTNCPYKPHIVIMDALFQCQFVSSII